MSFRSHLLVHQESLVSNIPRKQKRLSHQISHWLFLPLLLAGLFWGTSSFNVAHASSTAPLPYNANGNSENPPLVFYNAIQQSAELFVQHHPKVYLVFWGPEWNQDPDGVIPQVTRTFRVLAGSQYNNILSQYTDTIDYVHNDVQMAASMIDTSTPPSNLDIGFETPIGVWDNAQIRHEADRVIASHHWPVNQDSQVIVFPQKGSTYNHGSSFCGVHSYDSTAAAPYAYGEIQYGDQASCDPTGTVADDIAMTAVHEYAEMATDPKIFVSPTIGGQWYVAYGSGWHTKDGTKSTPQEIADLCEGYNGSSYAYQDYQDPSSGTFYTLPLLWSNADNGCVTVAWPVYEIRSDGQGKASLWKYTGTPLTGWQEINAQAGNVVAGGGHVYQLQGDDQGDAILSYNGTSTNWTALDTTGTAKEIALSSNGYLYKEDQDNSAWQYDPVTKWTQLSSSANSAPLGPLTAGPYEELYSQGEHGVWEYAPYTNGWQEIDNTQANGYSVATSLEAAPNGKLYELRSDSATDTETVWAYNGTLLSWTQIGTPDSLEIVSDGQSHLYQMQHGGTLWRYSGSGTTWVALNNPFPDQTMNFTASSTGQIFEILRTGAVWMLNGGTWTQIDNSTTSYQIASDNGGSLVNYTG